MISWFSSSAKFTPLVSLAFLQIPCLSCWARAWDKAFFEMACWGGDIMGTSWKVRAGTPGRLFVDPLDFCLISGCAMEGHLESSKWFVPGTEAPNGICTGLVNSSYMARMDFSMSKFPQPSSMVLKTTGASCKSSEPEMHSVRMTVVWGATVVGVSLLSSTIGRFLGSAGSKYGKIPSCVTFLLFDSDCSRAVSTIP